MVVVSRGDEVVGVGGEWGVEGGVGETEEESGVDGGEVEVGEGEVDEGIGEEWREREEEGGGEWGRVGVWGGCGRSVMEGLG
ncbi:hypothetical protein, partial [Corynebacterium glyciniphilum]|uniref:hypothetical protein n=1 Tax=Corynebacterium glyciniphilum TaxID=1404244 RepID=UPI001C930DD7